MTFTPSLLAGPRTLGTRSFNRNPEAQEAPDLTPGEAVIAFGSANCLGAALAQAPIENMEQVNEFATLLVQHEGDLVLQEADLDIIAGGRIASGFISLGSGNSVRHFHAAVSFRSEGDQAPVGYAFQELDSIGGEPLTNNFFVDFEHDQLGQILESGFAGKLATLIQQLVVANNS